jgi:hypothetical protein
VGRKEGRDCCGWDCQIEVKSVLGFPLASRCQDASVQKVKTRLVPIIAGLE